ncbi:hypothetical protein GCM10020295_61930 [Streptomyces cinereospinus]
MTALAVEPDERQVAEVVTGHVLALWRELTDTAWDYGIAPDDALTPRKAAARIVRLGQLDEPTARSVHRVAGAVEQVLFARGRGRRPGWPPTCAGCGRRCGPGPAGGPVSGRSWHRARPSARCGTSATGGRPRGPARRPAGRPWCAAPPASAAAERPHRAGRGRRTPCPEHMMP